MRATDGAPKKWSTKMPPVHVNAAATASSLSSTALTVQQQKRPAADSQLMPPPPPPKKIKRPRQVLDEDTYTDALSHIIARDFFPGLRESASQAEYLDALEAKDAAWIAITGQRLKEAMMPRAVKRNKEGGAAGRSRRLCSSDKPATATSRRRAGDTQLDSVAAEDTPMSVASSRTNAVVGGEQERSRSGLDTNMSLSAFQAKYTSEDNESFYQLLDQQNQKRAESHAWLWTGNRLPSRQQIKQREVEERIAATRGSLTDDGFKKERLAIRDRDAEDRPAAPDTWLHRPRNALMFVPGGIEDDLETVAERMAAASRAPPRTIMYENMRAPDPEARPALGKENDAAPNSSSGVPPSPSISAIRNAIARRRRSSDVDSFVHGGETPRVNGYVFVDDEEPEPAGRTTTAVPEIKLGPGDAKPNPFMIREQRKRESLHHRLVERIAQSKRTSARLGATGRVETAPVPRLPGSARLSASGGLTPAAQRLWEKIGAKGRTSMQSPFNGSSSRTRTTPRLTPIHKKRARE